MQITQRATPAVYRMLSRGCRGGFPCLHIPRKAVSELYREKIESLQAEESRLLAQKAAAQSAAAEMVRQAEKDLSLIHISEPTRH